MSSSDNNLPNTASLGQNLSIANSSTPEPSSQSADVVANATATTGLTTFTDVDATITNTLGRSMELELTSKYPQDLKSFLERPQLLDSISWTTSQVPNTNLLNYSVGSVLANNALFSNKLLGFGFVRGTAVFKVVLNANPFQQGKLLLHFLPCTNQADSLYTARHNYSLANTTQQPCIILDARETSCVFEVPYIAPTDYYAWDGNNSPYRFDWGTFYLDVLALLRTGSSGDTGIEVSVYMYFKDFELAGPIIPQSSMPTGRKVSSKNRMVRRTNIGDTEQEDFSKHPISKALSMGAKIADSLEDVPLLNAISGTASWVLNGLSGVAGYFGWSKPITDVVPIVVSRQFNRHMANSDGLDTSLPLGLLNTGKIDVNRFASFTDEDEMSFNYLKKISSYVSSYTWTTSMTPGSNLLYQYVGPQNLYQQSTQVISTNTAYFNSGPPIYYLSNFFSLYRGSIIVDLYFVKTNFHSGRVEVCFIPITGSSSQIVPYGTDGDTGYVLREIVDIRYQDHVRLCLPYLLPQKYISTNQSFGYLSVNVINTLCSPETCSPTIDILAFYSGGPDFEFAAPSGSTDFSSPSHLPFSAQGGTEVVSSSIGPTPVQKMNLDAARFCVSEAVTSIKQLCSRFTRVVIANFPLAGTINNTTIWPYFSALAYQNSSTGVVSVPNLGFDAFSCFAPGYAFYRGGVRLGILNSSNSYLAYSCNPIAVQIPGSTNAIVSDSTSTYYTPIGNAAFPLAAVLAPTVGVVAEEQLFATVAAPYYCSTHSSLVSVSTSTNYIPADVSQPITRIGVDYLTSTSAAIGLYRAFNDDLQLSYFIGFPALYVNLN